MDLDDPVLRELNQPSPFLGLIKLIDQSKILEPESNSDEEDDLMGNPLVYQTLVPVPGEKVDISNAGIDGELQQLATLSGLEWTRPRKCSGTSGLWPMEETCGQENCNDCYTPSPNFKDSWEQERGMNSDDVSKSDRASNDELAAPLIRPVVNEVRTTGEGEPMVENPEILDSDCKPIKREIQVNPEEIVFHITTKSGETKIAVVTEEELVQIRKMGAQMLQIETAAEANDKASISNSIPTPFPKSDNESNKIDDDKKDEDASDVVVTAVDGEKDNVAKKETLAPKKKRRIGHQLSTKVETHIIRIDNVSAAKGRKDKDRDYAVVGTSKSTDNAEGFKCLECDTEFFKKSQKFYHIYCNPVNGKSPFECQYCFKGCANGSHLIYHERSKHTKEKPFTCAICPSSFFQKVKLNRHMLTHSKNKPLKKPTLGGQKYSCNLCKKEFSDISNVRRHLATHSDRKDFKCEICAKAFTTKYCLTAHLSYHNIKKKNDRPHKCSHCEMAFNYKKDLKRHTLIHSGEKPFKCVVTECLSKGCARRDNFERHLRNVHHLQEEEVKKISDTALEKYKTSKLMGNQTNRES